VFVKSIMLSKNSSITVEAEEILQVALEKFEAHEIDGMPVLSNGKYYGIITRFQIYKAFFSLSTGQSKEEFVTKTKIKEIATCKDIYLDGEEVFEKTLIMLKDLPVLAVIDKEQHFLGTVTRSDVLEHFRSAFGMNKKGIRIAFTSVETEGRIAKLAEIAKSYHEQIISLVTFDETDKLIRRIVIKVAENDNIDKFVNKLESSGFRVLSINKDL